MNKNAAKAEGRAKRFSLSMTDWTTYNMVMGLIDDFQAEKGMDVEAAYKLARAVMGAVSFGPTINVETGNEGGVVVEDTDGIPTFVGFVDFTGGSGPTARLVLEEAMPTFYIG